jgi:hypothetical protein
MQNGVLRIPLAFACGLSAAAALLFAWQKHPSWIPDVVGPMQKAAFVAAAFGVTAYNLRTRVVDFVLKLKARPRRMEELCKEARLAGKRLRILVLLFTFTAAVMASGGLLAKNGWFEWVWAALGAGLFVGSFVSFFYLVFAFEKLEEFILEEHEEIAKEEEATRLTKNSGKDDS